MLINKLCIIGVGLIGGSLARALKAAGECAHVVGCGRNIEHLKTAQKLGVIDSYHTDMSCAAKDADVIVLATPLGVMADAFQRIYPVLIENTLITDVGSTKASVAAQARAHLGEHLPRFVPGHPIAGSEQNGVTASFAELFQNRRVILTPLPETDDQAHQLIQKMWNITGAEVVEMEVMHHDEVLAATSHLPHVLAYTLVDTLAQMEDRREIFRFAAGGFRDFTRIASSHPRMWHDICLANQDALVQVLDIFARDLQQVSDMIRHADSQSLEDLFTRAKQKRDEFSG